MRYVIRRPASPVRPNETIPSQEHLDKLWPRVTVDGRVGEQTWTVEAYLAGYVRETYPESIALPFPVRVGSGELIMLGIIESARVAFNQNEPLPFVWVIQPVGDGSSRERARIGSPTVFDRGLWKPAIFKPDAATTEILPVEVRATDLAAPVTTSARVGRVNGKLCIYLDVDGVELSVVFDGVDWELVNRDAERAL